MWANLPSGVARTTFNPSFEDEGGGLLLPPLFAEFGLPLLDASICCMYPTTVSSGAVWRCLQSYLHSYVNFWRIVSYYSEKHASSTAHLEIPASQNIGSSLSSRSFLTADGKRANRAVQKVVVCVWSRRRRPRINKAFPLRTTKYFLSLKQENVVFKLVYYDQLT